MLWNGRTNIEIWNWRNLRRAYLEMFGDEALVESKEPKLVKDKKQKNLKTMNKPTRYERRKIMFRQMKI